MSETSTPQGELVIGNLVHGAMINCMITLYDDPDGWFFKQFSSQDAILAYAVMNNLIMKRDPNGIDSQERE